LVKLESQEIAMTETKRTTRITQVGTVIIPVSDQEKALEFYVGTLGFEKRMDAPFGAGDRWIEVAPPGAATTIALVPLREGGPTDIVVSFATEDAEADHTELLARAVEADAAACVGTTSHRCSRFATRTATGSGWWSGSKGRARRAVAREAFDRGLLQR
jgi:catechol 2,3-dioxygenase-like lactoylglutathione lyase family enzyme